MYSDKSTIGDNIREPIKSMVLDGKEEKLTLIGQGATSLVYTNESQTMIYKEFFPVLDGYVPALRRTADGELVELASVLEHVLYKHAYDKCRRGFTRASEVASKIRETYKGKNADMRIYPEDCKTPHGLWQKCIAAPGDLFSDYLSEKVLMDGRKFKDYFVDVLFSVCLLIRDVHNYHKVDYINMDIKPENLYILYNDAGRASAVRNLDFGSALNITDLLCEIDKSLNKAKGTARSTVSNVINQFFSTTEQFYYERALRRAIEKCTETNEYQIRKSALIRLDAIAVLKILLYSLSGCLNDYVYINLGDENIHLKRMLRDIFSMHNVTGSKNLFEEYNCYFHLYELITYVFTNNDAENMMAEFENRLLDILCMLGKAPGADALTPRQEKAIALNKIFAAASGELTQRKLKTVGDICNFADESGLWVPASPAELNYYFTAGINREVLRVGGSAYSCENDSVKKKVDLKLFADIICGDKTYTIFDDQNKCMQETADIPLIQLYDSIEGNKRLLVIGNASQGKTTSMRILAAEMLYRDKLCLFYQCRDFRSERDFEDIKSTVEKLEAAAPVLVFDAYDELDSILRSDFINMLKSFDTLEGDIIISSRYDFINKKSEDVDDGFTDDRSFFTGYAFAENGFDNESEKTFENKYTALQMLPFKYEQLDSLVNESVNRDSEYFKLLELTMLLSMHRNFEKAQILGNIESQIKTEVAFINSYFSLLASKKKDLAYEDDYRKLGEYIYFQRADYCPEKVTRIPNYLKDILFYVKRKVKELDAINLKYLNFFEAYYVASKFSDCLDDDMFGNRRAVTVLRHLFLPETDETNEVLYYTGQLLAEKGYDEAAVFELFLSINRSYTVSMKGSFILGFFNGEVRDISGGFNLFDVMISERSSRQESAFVRSHIRSITAQSFRSEYINKFCKEGLPRLGEISVNNEEFRSEGNCLIKRSSNELWLGSSKSVIPADVLFIRKNSFSNSHLTEIIIPDSVIEIDSLAFKHCEALERVEFGERVRRIHEAAFYYCTNLRKVVFKQADLYVDNRDGCHKRAFEGSNNIEDMTLPTTALIYPYYVSNNEVKILRVFQGNEYGRLRSLSFTDIPRFNGLRELYIAADVEKISEDAFFKRYNSFEKIVVEEGNKYYYSVDNCLIDRKTKCIILGCKNSIIPDDGSVTRIGGYAFATVDGMTTVEIGEHIEDIGEYAFAGCDDLETVIVNANPKNIGIRAFVFNNKLKNVRVADPEGWSQVMFATEASNPINFAKKVELPKEVNKTVKIKQGRTKISSGAFRYGNGIEKVIIPATVEEIGGTAFLECGDLKDVYIEDLKAWCGISFKSYSANPLYNNARLWVNDEQVRELNIGKDIKKITKRCFVRCMDLESVCFEGDIEIGELAFDACMDLKKVYFKSPNVKIEENAFSNCSVDVYFCGTPEQWELVGGDIILGVNNVFFEDK